MLELEILGDESLNEETNEFLYGFEFTLKLEHSLSALSKWEAKYEKPFLNNKDLNASEMLDYIRFMALNEDVPDRVYSLLDNSHVTKINDYIKRKQTATFFKENPHVHGKPAQEVITSEVVYYWLVAYRIPFEVQYWNLNRLLTLVQVLSEKNKNPKGRRMNRRDLMRNRRELNNQRLANQGTTG